jgi:hypothetical protein
MSIEHAEVPILARPVVHGIGQTCRRVLGRRDYEASEPVRIRELA